MVTARIVLMLGLLWSALLLGCARQMVERELKKIDQAATLLLSRDGPLLKLHCRDGSMYMLDQWQWQKQQKLVEGSGVVFSFNRDILGRGTFQVPYDSIAIAEINRLVGAPNPVAGFALMATITGIGAIYCASNPKACFGSCPTFYAWDGSTLSLMAEGFSASIAPSLAANDIDALYRAVPTGRTLGLLMRNEALETHVVQGVRLLAVQRPPSGRVFKTSSGQFWQAGSPIPPYSVMTASGRAENLLQAVDGKEYFSLADSSYLATHETLDLFFRPGAIRRPGLVIAHRQTLMTTFLLYQTLAYMGESAGYWLAKLERSGLQTRSSINGPGDLLGTIEVLVENQTGDWHSAGEVGETGPIASDLSLVPFPEESRRNDGAYHVRLRMAKGYWRIDYAALVDLVAAVQPLALYASIAPGPETDGLSRSNRDTVWSEPIITVPGNSYVFSFTLPDNPEHYELFLDARGYYLEWIRETWLAEENPDMVLLMLQDPEAFLHRMAPLFKHAEPTMEETFWRSKYETIQ